jgi:CheY-like chemotaxis protein
MGMVSLGQGSPALPGDELGRARVERKTLLVVDDNPSIRESLALLLRLAGYHVVEAEDGEQAIGLLAAERPDLVLTDLRMPGMSGVELIQRMRESGHEVRRTPVVAVSVHGPRELKIAHDAGADAWFDKLSDFEELLGTVRMLLGETKAA